MASATDNYDATLLVFARAFDKRRIKYALIGGEAVSRLTRPRFTKDLDFLLTVPQVTLPGLLEELNELGCDIDLLPTIREWTQHQMIVFRYLGTRIDWLGPVVDLYQHILDSAITKEVDGYPVRIATAEGLIVMKLHADRPQDRIDVEAMIATLRGSLDLNWIKSEWETLFELDDPRMQWFLETHRKVCAP